VANNLASGVSPPLLAAFSRNVWTELWEGAFLFRSPCATNNDFYFHFRITMPSQ
jgi:hypothetical protein